MTDDANDIFKQLLSQFQKDLLLESNMKKNPRVAIVNELSAYWNFTDQTEDCGKFRLDS